MRITPHADLANQRPICGTIVLVFVLLILVFLLVLLVTTLLVLRVNVLADLLCKGL